MNRQIPGWSLPAFWFPVFRGDYELLKDLVNNIYKKLAQKNTDLNLRATLLHPSS